MPLTKNQILRLSMRVPVQRRKRGRHWEGRPFLFPNTAPGDEAEVRIVKPMKGYAFGRLEKLLAPGPGRIEPDCPAAGPCGGCGLRHMAYAAECQAKRSSCGTLSPGWAGWMSLCCR